VLAIGHILESQGILCLAADTYGEYRNDCESSLHVIFSLIKVGVNVHADETLIAIDAPRRSLN